MPHVHKVSVLALPAALVCREYDSDVCLHQIHVPADPSQRPAPAPRTNSAPPPRAPRQPRQPPQVANNSAPRRPRETATEQYSAPRDNTTDLFPQQQQSSARPANTNVKSNGRSAAREPAVNSYNVRGAAKSEQNVVVGENFVVGTSAADIEVVMLDVGGAMNSCEVVATRPAVTVEMSFVDRQGGQAVIDTFDGKKVCLGLHHTVSLTTLMSRHRLIATPYASTGRVLSTEHHLQLP